MRNDAYSDGRANEGNRGHFDSLMNEECLIRDQYYGFYISHVWLGVTCSKILFWSRMDAFGLILPLVLFVLP